MASRTVPGVPSRWRSAKRASASLMAAWARASSARGSLIVERLDIERSVGELGETLHARLGFGQRARRFSQAGDALLEQRERGRELQGLALELLDDRVEAGETLLDRHRALPSGRTATVVASTSPSRTRRVNGSPGAKSRIEECVAPSAPRATAYPRSSVASGESALSRPARAATEDWRCATRPAT